MTHALPIADLAATEAFGRRLGALLFPGAVLALVGRMGAGKTHLTRAIAEGLGVRNPAVVNSPTFVLIQEYPARVPIYHFDAYRLSGPAEFAELGADEIENGSSDFLSDDDSMRRLSSHGQPTDDARVVSLAISEDGRSLATIGDRGLVKLWQREQPREHGLRHGTTYGRPVD